MVPFLNQRNLDDLKIMTNFQLANCARVIVAAAAVAASNVCTKKGIGPILAAIALSWKEDKDIHVECSKQFE